MSSAKSSRSRPSVPSGVYHPNGGPTTESGVQLADKLKIFKTENFDPDSYVQSKCQAMNEKEIRHLCSYLQDLKKASAEEMRKSVYANYAAFIRTSKEISDLEGELLSIRNLLSTQAALIHGLSDGVSPSDSLSSSSDSLSHSQNSNVEDSEPSEVQKWAAEFPDMLDVLLAERRVDEALDALDGAERVVGDAKRSGSLTAEEVRSLHDSISEHRQKLADQLAEAACQSSTRGVELRAASSALKRLGDGPRAHSLLLNAHNQRLQFNLQNIHPTSTSYGGAYTAALSQQVFSVINQALTDSLEVFGDESCYTSELVIWSTRQAENFARLIKRHVLGSCAASGGLRGAAECVQIALGHCALLEARGLSLSSVLLKLFRPSVEQALDANLKRIEESTAALAAADDWVLTSGARGRGVGSGMQPKMSSSAHRFNSMVQDFFEDVGPLLSLQLGGSTMDGLLKVFNSYIDLLKSAVPNTMDDELDPEGSGNKIVRPAVTESQQLALLANASLLAEDLLPRAASRLYHAATDETRKKVQSNRMPELKEWKRKLQRAVDRLRDNFCRQNALELIFTEDGDDGESRLCAQMYIDMDSVALRDHDWAPSPVFQDLYAKLNRMASIAQDMFVGRERFATLLMMKMIEPVILFISDQSFWEEIEQGPHPLGPNGLQQFYLDMQFVLTFGQQGRFLSRHVHQVILEIIQRAVSAFAATGLDPNDVLETEEWFEEIAHNYINMISGRGRMANGDRDLNSPTASVSAHSMSSV
ncbi:hypothetical protein LUZ60_010495 [Juncus effusus]|nr:hypothetical protein LUZ60_010495 [Juncus effusus]